MHKLVIGRFDRDWKKIEAFIGSKTVIQVKKSSFSLDSNCHRKVRRCWKVS